MNSKIALQFVKAINDHNVDEIVNLMSENHVFVDAMDGKHIGRKGMKEGWKSYFELFPDYKIEILDVVERGEVVALFGYAGGTYKNLKNDLLSDFWRTPASWKAIVKDEKILHWQVYCDYSKLFKIIDKSK
jgi:ketosteroid isomerase-like protein